MKTVKIHYKPPVFEEGLKEGEQKGEQKKALETAHKML
jgi:hypothetical protein